MPSVVIRRSHISPSAAGQCPEDAYAQHSLGQYRVRPRGEYVPEKYERESRAGSDSDENLEDRTFRVPVTYCC